MLVMLMKILIRLRQILHKHLKIWFFIRNHRNKRRRILFKNLKINLLIILLFHSTIYKKLKLLSLKGQRIKSLNLSLSLNLNLRRLKLILKTSQWLSLEVIWNNRQEEKGYFLKFKKNNENRKTLSQMILHRMMKKWGCSWQQKETNIKKQLWRSTSSSKEQKKIKTIHIYDIHDKL